MSPVKDMIDSSVSTALVSLQVVDAALTFTMVDFYKYEYSTSSNVSSALLQ